MKFVHAFWTIPTLFAGLALAWGCTAAIDTTSPAEPASGATCERLADHLVSLIDEELGSTGGSVSASRPAAGQRPALLRACMQYGDAATAACLLRARELQEAERCGDLDARPQPS